MVVDFQRYLYNYITLEVISTIFLQNGDIFLLDNDKTSHIKDGETHKNLPTYKNIVALVEFQSTTRMSRWKLGSMGRITGLFHLLIYGVYCRYKPLVLTFDPNFPTHPSIAVLVLASLLP